MNYRKLKIKEGIDLHLLKNEFKTDFSVVFLSLPLEKETITKNALLPAVLKSGSKNYITFQKITETLEMLYGGAFDCGIDKTGDNIVLKFYIESINDKYLPEKNNNLEETIRLLLDIVFNPYIEKDGFNEKYIEIEKKNLETIINSLKDDKDLYSYERCINLMYKNNGYGLSKYGRVEDLEKIDSKSLFEHYRKVIQEAKIDIFISGDFENEAIINLIYNNILIKSLNDREEPIVINNYKTEIKEKITAPNITKEQFDVTQGKLVIGLEILPNDFNDFRFIAILYNAILGNGVNSKLFQIVREKEGLAYTTRSEYIVQKNNIIIRCGIEIDNYQKTVNLIMKLLDEMREGRFTLEDLKKVKEYIISGIEAIDEEQDSQILYKFGQELSKNEMELDEYKVKINNVTKEEIIEFANYVQINTIYFLESGGKNV